MHTPHYAHHNWIIKYPHSKSNIDKTVYASGYRSFFDITPDLRFILGQDSKYTNLFHNLGSGQAMKYSPVLGESVAEEIMNESFIKSCEKTAGWK